MLDSIFAAHSQERLPADDNEFRLTHTRMLIKAATGAGPPDSRFPKADTFAIMFLLVTIQNWMCIVFDEIDLRLVYSPICVICLFMLLLFTRIIRTPSHRPD